MNPIYHLESDLSTSCGLAEMPGWGIVQAGQAHLRKDSVILGIEWLITNSSQNGGLNHVGNIPFISLF